MVSYSPQQLRMQKTVKKNKCKECDSPHVVNKFHMMCQQCNNMRLHGSKFGKTHKFTPKRNSSPSVASKAKRDRRIKEDEEFYETVFNSKPHECEECRLNGINTPLPNEFRDYEGKVNARWQYSHVVPKSITPKHLRHDPLNMNRLCLQHHEQWENGDSKSMKIYAKNKMNFPSYLQE